MNSWHPSLYTHWYAVARADQLGRKPVSVTVLDTHVALARSADGSLIALEDRCPHRHAPLSAGCVVGQRLSCPYHGWSFAADGLLADVPGLPEGITPPAVRVRAFPAVELDGLIWLRPSEHGADAPNAMIRGTDPGTRRFIWNTRWQAYVVDAMENFLDPMHTHFIHAGLVRRDGRRRAATALFQLGDAGFVVDYQSGSSQSGLLYRLFESRRVAERAHYALPGSTRLEYAYANGSRILIDLHFTPRDRHATDVFVTTHVEGRWAPAWAVRLLAWPFLRKVNAQDARMLQLQSTNKQRFGERRGASTQLDIVRGALERFWSHGDLDGIASPHQVDMLL